MRSFLAVNDTSRRILIALLLSVLLVMALFLATSIVCRAQSTAPGSAVPETERECEGLDLVILLDQSGSMVWNDPNKIRSNAVKSAVDILGDNALYFCPGAQHRLAVLGFGDRPGGPPALETYIRSAVISPTLETIEQWNAQRKLIKASVPITQDLGNTDHALALRAAAEILREWRAQPLGEMPRKRAVLLITDGEPCVGDLGCSDKGWAGRSAYIRSLEDLTDPLGTDFPFRGENNPNSVHIWLIGLQDTRRRRSYLDDPLLRETWNRITRLHGGEVLVLESGGQNANADLTSKVTNALNPMLGSRLKTWNCQEPIWIEPYLSQVAIIHVFRLGANPGVSLDDVVVTIKAMRGEKTIAEFGRGQVLSGRGRVDDYTRDGPNERYVFYLPPPGKYLVEVQGADACRDLDVRLGQRGATAVILEPGSDAAFSETSEPPYYDIFQPAIFRFQFLQQGGQGKSEPLREDPDYPLDARVRVRGRGEIAKSVNDEYTLVRVDQAKAIYEARDRTSRDPQYLRTPVAGQYVWELSVTTRDPRAEEGKVPITQTIEVIAQQGEFTVFPVEKFGFQILEPRQGDVLLASDLKDGKSVPVPIQVTIQLTDTKGGVLSPDRVLADKTADTFELRLLDESGRQIGSTSRLRLTGTGEDLMFSGQLRVLPEDQPPDPPGQYRLEVSLLDNYLRGKYYPLSPRQSVTFRRERAREISFAIVEPPEGAELPLEEGKLSEPLRVQVQVLDEDGKPLDAAIPFATSGAQPFRASLLTQEGQQLDFAQMKLKTANIYVAEFESPDIYKPACYQITVDLSEEYFSQVFRPKFRTAKLTRICLRAVQRFSWSIAQPMTGTYTIHPMLGLCPKPIPLRLAVEAFTKDGEPAPAAELQKAKDNPLFVGKLIVPGRQAPYELVYYPDENTGQFLADWPAQLAAKGDYKLEVTLVKGANSPMWLPSGPEQMTRSFRREDTLLTMPWSLLALIVLLLIVVSDVVFLVLASGPLAGAVLVFLKPGLIGPEEIGQVNIGGPLNRHRYVAKKNQLDRDVPTLGLERIEVKGTKSTEEGASFAANIRLKWASEEGEPGESDDLEGVLEGETVRISGQGLRMQLKKQGGARVPTWLWVWIVATLVAWIGTCAYLYLQA